MGRKTGASRSARGASPSSALPPPTYPGPRKAEPAADAGTSSSSNLSPSRGLDETTWLACRGILEGVYKAKEGNRRICEIFRELPDREEYEDYYVAIPEPESLDNISAQLSAQMYDSPEDFFKQLHLVFLNAKHYNEENSQIWIDAKNLEDQVMRAWRAAAAEGTFVSADPYHKPHGRNRKIKTERGSTTPAPVASASPATGVSSLPMASSKSRDKAELEKRATATPAVVKTEGGRTAQNAQLSTSQTSQSSEAKPARPSSAASASVPTPAPTRNAAPVAATSAAALSEAIPAAVPPPTTRTTRHSSGSLSAPTALPSSDPSQHIPSVFPSPAALDAVLPRWQGSQISLPGPTGPTTTGGIPGSGWWGEGAPGYEASVGGAMSWKQRIKSVVTAVAGYRDASGVQLSITFALVPRTSELPFLSYNMPLAFHGIQQAAESGSYSNLRELDLDMTRLFEKARRALESRPVEYGRILTLQRLYQALTAPYPLQIPPGGVPAPNRTCFASIPAGPGVARSLFENLADLGPGAKVLAITTPRCGHKDRVFTTEARHKGISYRVGDFIHLINPDDSSRPIVGQIFKTFVPTKGYPTHHVTVCWYFRPEQTVHPADRKFFEREVFKTTNFCDHPVEDIIEKVGCQVHSQYIRGRPKAPNYYPGWPLYVCASRYNDRDWFMVVIKNWLNCMPESVRTQDFMSIVPFGRIFEAPTTSSPFVRGIRGPGILALPKRAPGPEDEEDEAEDLKRQPLNIQARRSLPSGITPQRGLVGTGMTPASAGQVPTGTGQPGLGSDTVSNSAQRKASSVATPTTQGSRAPQQHTAPPSPQPTGPFAHRTMTMAMGGPQVVEQHAKREMLPADTISLFEQDRHGQVLWFSGPPLAPGSVKFPQRASHSLEYLSYLVKKRARSNEVTPVSEMNRGANGGENLVKGARFSGSGIMSEIKVPLEDEKGSKKKKRKVKEMVQGEDADAQGEEEDEQKGETSNLKDKEGWEKDGEVTKKMVNEGESDDEDEDGEDIEKDLTKLWWTAGMSNDEILASLRAVATGGV